MDSPTINLAVISHHIGAGLFRLPLHTIELTKKMRQPVKVQAMYNRVPTFRALQCQGKGNRTRIIESGESTCKTMSIAGMMREIDAKVEDEVS